ncbi:hypothetical protein C8R43DRAFT_1143150 [Mycena crocata]|nr:hypothetical protein C8R43DRAFT_1143150 [Mycena crocata]
MGVAYNPDLTYPYYLSYSPGMSPNTKIMRAYPDWLSFALVQVRRCKVSKSASNSMDCIRFAQPGLNRSSALSSRLQVFKTRFTTYLMQAIHVQDSCTTLNTNISLFILLQLLTPATYIIATRSRFIEDTITVCLLLSLGSQLPLVDFGLLELWKDFNITQFSPTSRYSTSLGFRDAYLKASWVNGWTYIKGSILRKYSFKSTPPTTETFLTLLLDLHQDADSIKLGTLTSASLHEKGPYLRSRDYGALLPQMSPSLMRYKDADSKTIISTYRPQFFTEFLGTTTCVSAEMCCIVRALSRSAKTDPPGSGLSEAPFRGPTNTTIPTQKHLFWLTSRSSLPIHAKPRSATSSRRVPSPARKIGASKMQNSTYRSKFWTDSLEPTLRIVVRAPHIAPRITSGLQARSFEYTLRPPSRIRTSTLVLTINSEFRRISQNSA